MVADVVEMIIYKFKNSPSKLAFQILADNYVSSSMYHRRMIPIEHFKKRFNETINDNRKVSAQGGNKNTRKLKKKSTRKKTRKK